MNIVGAEFPVEEIMTLRPLQGFGTDRSMSGTMLSADLKLEREACLAWLNNANILLTNGAMLEFNVLRSKLNELNGKLILV